MPVPPFNFCWKLTQVCAGLALALPLLPLSAGGPQTTSTADASRDALTAIEAQRGGRHWADAPTDPPKTPAASLAEMRIEPGFRIELVAAEPLVRDPVAIAFDARGRMFVAEYGDYPEGPPAGEAPLSNIVMLEDSDGDGMMDRRHPFAMGLSFANSLMPYRGGLLVAAQTELLWLIDRDGDQIADQRQVLFEGFTPAHAQMQISCPRWGIDNKIYCNYGPGQIASPDQMASPEQPAQRVTLPRKDFWFDPLTMQFGSDSGLGQFGNTIDRFGRRFYCLNRNPIMTTLLSPEVLRRNPFQLVANPYYDVGQAGEETRVYPLVKMKSNYLSHAGTHTAACGTTAYLGEFGDDDYRSSVFVCEPIGHLVTRSIVRPEGLRLTAHRAESERDFLASTDTWFRPASLANGPDGALYLADMYRLWVEHPKFLPPEISAKLDWRAGADRGRIYRILPADAKRRSFTPPTSAAEATALLADPNGWRQFLGQRLLVEQQSTGVLAELRRLLRRPNRPATARLHALWTLDGLSGLTADDVQTALTDPQAEIRAAAVQLAHAYLPQQPVRDAVLRAANDSDVRVRFQAALTLAGDDSAAATRRLAELAIRDGGDPGFTDGLLTSVANRSGEILLMLWDDEGFRHRPTAGRRRLITQLAAIAAARGDPTELESILQMATPATLPPGTDDVWWQLAVVRGLAAGLPRHGGALGVRTLTALMNQPPEELAASIKRLREACLEFPRLATSAQHDPGDRRAAIELLGYLPLTEVESSFHEILGGLQPPDVQLAGVEALGRHGAASARVLISHWQELRPTARSQALTQLLSRRETTQIALQAMAEGHMEVAGLAIDQRVQLLKHPDESIREAAFELFGDRVSANRRQVAQQYQSALSIAGDAVAGRQVFQRVCASCHRRDGAGHEVGPDLSDTRNRSADAILFDILDPHAKVEPRFAAYSVLTRDGQLVHGLLSVETADAVVLQLTGGKQQTIARADIESIRVSEQSLMPEGMEQDVSVQQMADLLAYLKSDYSD